MRNLVSSYTRLACIVYSGEVSGEVGTRSRMCCVGWVVWVHWFWYFCYSRIIQLDLWYHLMFVEIICICTLNLQIYSVQLYINVVFIVIVGSLI